jgi:hypothetical protein
MPKEIRTPKSEKKSPVRPTPFSGIGIRVSGFFRISTFGLRIYSLAAGAGSAESGTRLFVSLK